MRPLRRFMLAFIIIFITVDLPFRSQSKTSLLGVILGIVGACNPCYLRRKSPCPASYGLVSGISRVGLFFGSGSNLLNIDDQLASRSLRPINPHFQRFTPCGSLAFGDSWKSRFLAMDWALICLLYMDHFGRYGLAEGLTFYKLVSIPHNLFIHILSETGLFGLIVIMGPFTWLGLRMFGQSDNRWLVLAASSRRFCCTASLNILILPSGTHYWLFGVLVLGLIGDVVKTAGHRRQCFGRSKAARCVPPIRPYRLRPYRHFCYRQHSY